MSTWAQIANGGVLHTREAESSPGIDWREVLADVRPTPSPTEEVVETGWTITATTARRTFALVPKPSGPPVTVVPKITEVHRWQFKLELDIRGHAATIVAAIGNLTVAQRRKAQAKWDGMPVIRRRDDLVNWIRTTINLTEAQMDELFAAASLHN